MNRCRLILAPVLVGLAVLIAGCSSTGTRKAGGYYQDDGPDANPPANLDNIPDAVPRLQPLASGANRPYTVFYDRYDPVAHDVPPNQDTCLASLDGTEQPHKENGRAPVTERCRTCVESCCVAGTFKYIQLMDLRHTT